MFQFGMTISNFYAFLIELSFSLLFLVLFGTFHYNFVVNKKLGDTLEEKKEIKFLYFFIFGALLSSLTFGVSRLTTLTIDIHIGMPMIILGLVFAMSFFYSSAVQVGAIIPSIFWVLIEYNAFKGINLACSIRLVVVCVLALISIVIGLFKEKKLLIFVLGSIVFAGIYLFLLVWIAEENWDVYIVEALVGVLTSMLFFTICRSLNKMLANISNISKRTTFMDRHYLVPSLIDSAFSHFVKSNKAKQVLVCTIDDDKIKDYDLKKHLSDNLFNALKKEKILFFKTPDNKYAFALADEKYYISNLNLSYKGNLLSERKIEDKLSHLENLLSKLPRNIFSNIKCYVSVYGVHSYDINELIWFNQFMIKNEDLLRSNAIKLFNSNMINHIKNDRINYAALISQVNLEEFDVELEEIKLGADKQKYVCPRFYWTKKLTCDVNEIMSQFDIQTADTLLRYLAIKSIELYESSEFKGNNKLLIYYPINELTSSFFSINNIVNKLKLYGLEANDVIFSFNCKKTSNWHTSIIKHLKNFEDHGIQYMLVDLTSASALAMLKPKMVIFDSSIIQNKTLFSKFKDVAKQHKQNVLFYK